MARLEDRGELLKGDSQEKMKENDKKYDFSAINESRRICAKTWFLAEKPVSTEKTIYSQWMRYNNPAYQGYRGNKIQIFEKAPGEPALSSSSSPVPADADAPQDAAGMRERADSVVDPSSAAVPAGATAALVDKELHKELQAYADARPAFEKYKVTDIDFKGDDDDDQPDISVCEHVIAHVWEAEDEEDLWNVISDAVGWSCVGECEVV